jgi:hypothetical protein
VGDDTISGLGGDDLLIGDCSLVPDHFAFEGPCAPSDEGTDALDGGAGTDTCLDGETLASCESTALSVAAPVGSAHVSRPHSVRFHEIRSDLQAELELAG